jgi:valyl-tRNA synthetase
MEVLSFILKVNMYETLSNKDQVLVLCYYCNITHKKVFMDQKLLKPYNPKETEDRIYTSWIESDFFNPDTCIEEEITTPNSPHFSIILPPPNVTGTLHVGHAATVTIEDIMVRFERMRGKKTLWIPGTDHAALATQSKVEEKLYKEEKKTRHDFSREDFVKIIEQFAAQSHDTMVNQIKKMGASVDWSREAYTLDPKRTLAVHTAFKKMYDDGLIYRGMRIVNWDPKLQTTVSDEEVERVEEKVPLYYLKYGPFTIATTRPETKFGDKYIVMHPEDARYKKYNHGDKIELEWINGKVTATIIKDSAIDMEFGTGVMTITPWHDATDFEIALRHNLDKEQVIGFDAKLLPIAGEFSGIHIKKARPLIVEKMKEKGLLEKIDENYVHSLAVSSRGGGIIEPQIKKQWFVDVNKPFKLAESKIKGIEKGSEVTLKFLMKAAVEQGHIKILPDRFEKVYFHWIENLRDWCISRQIIFGHRVPVWYRKEEMYCGISAPEGEGWEQDLDTLDTWFSSGLWTFSTLGWPEETSDFLQYHPTSVLETAYDILFFWVARMILMTTYLLGDIPFKTVYMHGLVLDSKGRKMSKSLGNTVDPLVMVEKYGADATRLSFIIGTGPGNDSKLSEDKIRGYKNFANKIWNATRFVLSNTENFDYENLPELIDEDKTYQEELRKVAADVTLDLENFRFYLAAEKMYHYFWHTFADVVIEKCKSRLTSTDAKEKASAQRILLEILSTSLKLLHPFMPFITEEIWSLMPIPNKKMLVVEKWPNSEAKSLI